MNPVVTIEMESGGVIKAELYPEIAPNTVNNFISLVKKGFYDGVIFHRVIPGFMIQGGDPEGTGMGGPGYSIKGEFTGNGFKNELRHKRGVLSMARTMMPDRPLCLPDRLIDFSVRFDDRQPSAELTEKRFVEYDREKGERILRHIQLVYGE